METIPYYCIGGGLTGPVDECWNKENGRYRDQRSRPAGIEGIDLGELSRDQRNLVLLDGLVTEFLESKFKDSVDVHCLHQIEKPIVAPTGVSDNSVITRTSILKGRHSGTVYAHATSHIVVGNIPASFVGNLRSCRAGIGRLLRRYRVDYTREMLWYRAPRAGGGGYETPVGGSVLDTVLSYGFGKLSDSDDHGTVSPRVI